MQPVVGIHSSLLSLRHFLRPLRSLGLVCRQGGGYWSNLARVTKRVENLPAVVPIKIYFYYRGRYIFLQIVGIVGAWKEMCVRGVLKLIFTLRKLCGR